METALDVDVAEDIRCLICGRPADGRVYGKDSRGSAGLCVQCADKPAAPSIEARAIERVSYALLEQTANIRVSYGVRPLREWR